MEISDCCSAPFIDSFRHNPKDHHDPIPTIQCTECKNECEAVDEPEDQRQMREEIMDR